MKKTFWKILFTAVLATSTLTFTSCKEEEKNEPINVSVENPRYIAAEGDNLYITCYYPISVVRYDIEQKAITGICNLGQFHTEGIAAVDGKLYIASSSISDENYNYTYDNKLYVVDIASFKLVDSVTVGFNPAKVKKLDGNHIVYNTLGNYSTDFGGTYVMNTDNKEITPLNETLYNFDVYEGDIYGYTSPYGTLAFYKIDGSTLQSTQILTSWSANDNPYGINVNPNNGDIIVLTDGNYVANGDCYRFNNAGEAQGEAIQLNSLPSKAVAINADQLLVLNECAWGVNNAEVSKLDFATNNHIVNFFSQSNNSGLGDVAQDMILYKGKAYITVTFSNSLETVDPANGHSTRFAFN